MPFNSEEGAFTTILFRRHQQNVIWYSCKVPDFFPIVTKFRFSGQIFLEVCNIKIHENPASAVISNLGYAYPKGCTNQDIYGYAEKFDNDGKSTYVNSVRQDTTASVLIINILLRWRVQFMEIGSQGVRKWKKVENYWSSGSRANVCGQIGRRTGSPDGGNRRFPRVCELA